MKPWYQRTLRWAQTNLTEKDPARYDADWWRDHWRRTKVQGVIVNAGGIVAYYPSKFELQHRAEFLGDRDLYGEIVELAKEDGLTVLARMDSNRAHQPLYDAHPDWFAIDAEGNPTTNPEAALAGAMLPFGGHKGSAIGTMVELLAGIMIGDLTSPEVLDYLGTTTLAPFHGELIVAFSPEKFAAGRPGNPFARAEVLFEAIVGQGARLPSQRRFAARAKSEAEGVVLNKSEIEQLDRLLALGIDAIA